MTVDEVAMTAGALPLTFFITNVMNESLDPKEIQFATLVENGNGFACVVLLQLAIAVPVTDTSLLLEAKINGLQRNRTGYLE